MAMYALTLVAWNANAVPILVSCAYARPLRVASGMCTDKRSPEGKCGGTCWQTCLGALRAYALALVVPFAVTR